MVASGSAEMASINSVRSSLLGDGKGGLSEAVQEVVWSITLHEKRQLT